MTLFKRLALFLVCCSLVVVTISCSDSSTGSNETSQTQLDSKKGPGQSAELFLNGDQYTSLEVEIDYMPGHKPTTDGLNSAKTFLEERLHKQTVTFSTPTEVPSAGQSSYTSSDVRNLEDQYRDQFTSTDGNTLHVYFLVLDGEYSQSNVLGIAYWNTSVAFFGKTIEDISGTPPAAPSEEKIESTVFRHEFAHNMGLVDNGSPMQTDHKTSGSAHCTTDGCLMKPSVRTTDFFSNFSGSVPPLDDLCINDLQANGGK
ncbi:hypothetical protein [Fodinibius salinus]|nr:hypothetical protein [Fodinibius salinus]